MSDPLPVISLMNSLLSIQAYLRSATTAKLAPVVVNDPQNSQLVTNFLNWQEDLWALFWQAFVAGGIVEESGEVNTLFGENVTDQQSMETVFFRGGPTPHVVTLCDDLTNAVTQGQSLLTQLEGIANSIQSADQQKVDQLTSTATQLSEQFDQQEQTLTQGALGAATDVVATAVDVAIAVGTEGAAIQPLVKSVIKIGSDVINQLNLTDEINNTLGLLEAAWESLDQASADLAQVTLTCTQLEAVTNDASPTLSALTSFSNDWWTVAQATQVSASSWSGGEQAALQSWAAQMVRMSFSYATQSIDASAAAAEAGQE